MYYSFEVEFTSAVLNGVGIDHASPSQHCLMMDSAYDDCTSCVVDRFCFPIALGANANVVAGLVFHEEWSSASGWSPLQIEEPIKPAGILEFDSGTVVVGRLMDF